MHRFLLLPLLLGCGLFGDDAKDAAEGDADTDADSDADADADSDTDTDTDTDVDLGACPPYSGLAVEGRTWEWRYTDEQADTVGAGAWTSTLTSLTVDGDWTIEADAEYDIDGFDFYRMSYVQTGGCDAEGAWLFETDSIVEYSYSGSRSTVESVITYTTPYLIMPAGVAAGDEWTVDVEGTSMNTPGGPSEFAYTTTLSAERLEDVSVPAGDFSTMRFQTVTDSSVSSFWAERNIGSVATTGAELVSYR